MLRELGAFDETEGEPSDRDARPVTRGGVDGGLALAVVHLDEDAVDHRQDRGQHQRHLHHGLVGGTSRAAGSCSFSPPRNLLPSQYRPTQMRRPKMPFRAGVHSVGWRQTALPPTRPTTKPTRA